jgi:uncharacterized protein YodC (DUF2158 family)
MGERADHESIEVFAPGSEVLINNVLTGTVTGIQITRGNIVKYECAWWDEHGRHEEVLEAWEVKSNSDEQRKLRVNQVL